MMLKRSVWLFFVLLFAFALSIGSATGCQRSAENLKDTIVYQYVAPDSHVSLSVILPTKKIGIAERLRVRVLVEWPSRLDVVIEDIAWDDGGWTLIDSVHRPLSEKNNAEGEITTLESEFILEPFLPGEYSIPPIRVAITSANLPRHTLQSESISISVESALNPDDIGELAPAAGPYIPLAESDQPSRIPLWVIVIGTSLLVIVLLIRSSVRRMSVKTEDGPTPKAILQGIVNSSDIENDEAFDRLAIALSFLFPQLQETSEIRSMIEQCERARFSPNEQSLPDPARLAKHALELLGEYEETV